MARRRATESLPPQDAPIPRPRHVWAPKCWLIPLLLFLLTLFAAALVSGSMFPLVVLAWLQAWILLPILIAAAMIGLRITAPLAKTGAFTDTGWPDMARLILSLALGLGALSLAVLAAGSLHLLHGAIMLLILISAGAAGYRPSRDFLRAFDRALFKSPAPRALFILLLAAVPLAMLIIASSYPPGVLWNSEAKGYDVLEYHLQLPREYLLASTTAPLWHNAYSFLPANIEMLYLMVMSLTHLIYHSPDVLPAILPSGMLHALIALLAAGAVALSPIKLSPFARAIAFVAILAIPWTIVTGSLAYNDAGVLLFAALAFGLCIGARARLNMVIIGLLLGLAVGCKMTSGVMVAIPVAAVLIFRGRFLGLLLAATVALAIYSPWALRDIVATHTPGHIGNPIFPVAAGRLGLSQWTPQQAENFARNHAAPAPNANLSPADQRLEMLQQRLAMLLDPQWSPNYIAIEQWSGNPPGAPINWLTAILGRIGLLWFVFPVALAAALSRGKTAWRLLLILGVQFACWILFTHIETRFFLPAAIPIALLLALGTERGATFRLLVAAIIGLQALLSGFLLAPWPKLFLGPQEDPAKLVDALDIQPEVFRYPDIFLPSASGQPARLPDQTVTYLVGEARPLYYHGTVYYHTVWDTDPLMEIFKHDGPAAAVAYLRTLNVQYLIVNWSEIDRFRGPDPDHAYGFDPAVTPDMFAQMEKAGIIPLAAAPSRILIYQLK